MVAAVNMSTRSSASAIYIICVLFLVKGRRTPCAATAAETVPNVLPTSLEPLDARCLHLIVWCMGGVDLQLIHFWLVRLAIFQFGNLCGKEFIEISDAIVKNEMRSLNMQPHPFSLLLSVLYFVHIFENPWFLLPEGGDLRAQY